MARDSSINLENFRKTAEDHRKMYKNFLSRVDKKEVLRALPELHEKAFAEINCLQCAHCCKTYSPRFKTPDIKRISKKLKLRESELIEKYLRLDEDGDYVTRTSPCPFLGTDNHCSIYEDRPSDCRRFPYSDEDVFFKRPALTLKNSEFCPIVVSVLEGLLKKTT